MEVLSLREKVAELLLADLLTGTDQWWYISVASDSGFVGGWLIPGKGPTDAWTRLHGLNAIPKGASTLTNGPVSDEALEKIPDSMRLRQLSKTESENLGG